MSVHSSFRTIRKTSLVSAALALTVTAAFALPPGVHINRESRTVTIDPGITPSFVRPVRHIPRGSKIVFSNIGYDYPKGLYGCCYGFDIAGPDSIIGQAWTAIAFTPSKSTDVRAIEAGIGYIEGDNTINFGIWSDSNGVPGTELAGADETVSQTDGNCCALVTFKTKVSIEAGTQYWVVCSTDSANTTAFSSRLANSTDEVDGALQASNSGSGWRAGRGLPAVNFTVYGK